VRAPDIDAHTAPPAFLRRSLVIRRVAGFALWGALAASCGGAADGWTFPVSLNTTRDSAEMVLGLPSTERVLDSYLRYTRAGVDVRYDANERVQAIRFFALDMGGRLNRASVPVAYGITAADSMPSLLAKLGPPTSVDTTNAVAREKATTWVKDGITITAYAILTPEEWAQASTAPGALLWMVVARSTP